MIDLDIIVPVFNEAGNIQDLVKRIHETNKNENINYQLIFIDDHSTDDTQNQIKKLQNEFPIILHIKKGEKGKAFSIIEGAKLGKSKFIAMIDGDLQYPPEAIPEMFEIAKEKGLVIANRKTSIGSIGRRMGSKVNKFVFGKLILGFDNDVQSGLKVFRREIFENLDTSEITKWTFDIPLLYSAKKLNFEIGSYDIVFEERKHGTSKISFIKSAIEIAKATLKFKLSEKEISLINPPLTNSMKGAGVTHKGKTYITHTTLHHKKSALFTLSKWQKIFMYFAIILFLLGIIINAKITILFLIAFLSTLYSIDVMFTLYVLLKSLRFPPEIKIGDDEIKSLDDSSLPIYSILCPLYKESKVLPHFIESIKKIDWPKEKLDVILLLEEDDPDTISAANSMNLPDYIKTAIVPHSPPKTKPKACNFGLQEAKGGYVVIYDAEDKPDPLQLKKVYIAFQKSDKSIFCLQSKLNYYNTNQNFLTRLFTAEYCLWFDLVLPGLQSIDTAIPLGGTSNHFRTKNLKNLKGWDPFNVTEDCDLGVRLFREGYKTAIIDSVTYEEANSNVKNWLRQRSRWIKGYFQTYLVHMREPIKFIKENGVHGLIFQLVIGMRMNFILINPWLWLATISYFVLRGIVGPTIETLYPAPVFYTATISLIFGNFIYFYNYMIACGKKDQWGLIKYMFLIPFYWLLTSVAAYMGFFQLIVNPHYWEKTNHGLAPTSMPAPAPVIT